MKLHKADGPWPTLVQQEQPLRQAARGAVSTGRFSSRFFELMLAPNSSSTCIISGQSFCAAACSGVSRNLPFCTFAPIGKDNRWTPGNVHTFSTALTSSKGLSYLIHCSKNNKGSKKMIWNVQIMPKPVSHITQWHPHIWNITGKILSYTAISPKDRKIWLNMSQANLNICVILAIWNMIVSWCYNNNDKNSFIWLQSGIM